MRHNIFVKVYHTLSELDVLLPLFLEMKNEMEIEVTIFINNRTIYEQFLASEFLRYAASSVNIKVIKPFSLLPKGKKPSRNTPILRMIYNLRSILNLLFILPFETVLLFKNSVYMHEITGFKSQVWLMYVAKTLLPKRVVVAYPHATAFNFSNIYHSKSRDRSALLLSFDKRTEANYKSLGYKKSYIIGYPKFFESWNRLIREYSSKRKDEPYVLIFSRPIHHFYMDEEIYIWLFESAYRVIRRSMGGIQIIIKTHPREDKGLIEEIIKKNGMQNIELSDEYAPVLATKASVAISFYTSAILDSLALGVPSVEYYREAKRFRESEKEGSMYKKMGIASVDSEEGLYHFLCSVAKGEYKRPSFLDEDEFSFVDVRFLDF